MNELEDITEIIWKTFNHLAGQFIMKDMDSYDEWAGSNTLAGNVLIQLYNTKQYNM